MTAGCVNAWMAPREAFQIWNRWILGAGVAFYLVVRAFPKTGQVVAWLDNLMQRYTWLAVLFFATFLRFELTLSLGKSLF